jgi:hypothetical protein
MIMIMPYCDMLPSYGFHYSDIRVVYLKLKSSIITLIQRSVLTRIADSHGGDEFWV